MNDAEERIIQMVELDVDLDDDTVEKLIKYARENIDDKALINWAVNDILGKMVERETQNQKEEI